MERTSVNTSNERYTTVAQNRTMIIRVIMMSINNVVISLPGANIVLNCFLRPIINVKLIIITK